VKRIAVPLEGLLLFEPQVFGDSRGFFQETWNQRTYGSLGLSVEFVQDNLAFSQRGVLRGLHFQNPHSQAKFVYVLQGEVFDVAVDLRQHSPTFGQWFGEYLSAENRRQLYIPPCFAHGYVVTSDTCLFAYKCDDYYSPATQHCIRWNDPAIGIHWPIEKLILAPRDEKAPLLQDLPRECLFP
jgi:dTDP-4-dehydrorhamnose 3,5-epimerase